MPGLARLLLTSILVVAAAAGAGADQRPSVALLRLEALGLDAGRAAGLDALFRAELERVAGRPLAPRAAVDALLERSPELRACTGAPACLSAIGRQLGVDRVVWGNVGELGDSYLVSLRLIDVARRAEERRVEERMRGNADELIEAVRVAAHRLLDPASVRGGLAIAADLRGARVVVDGRDVGRTPLPAIGLPVGPHRLRVEAPGFLPYSTEVTVRFEKVSQVDVSMTGAGPERAPRPASWLSSPWTYVAVGAVAIAAGVIVGRALAPAAVVDCGAAPGRCR